MTCIEYQNNEMQGSPKRRNYSKIISHLTVSFLLPLINEILARINMAPLPSKEQLLTRLVLDHQNNEIKFGPFRQNYSAHNCPLLPYPCKNLSKIYYLKIYYFYLFISLPSPTWRKAPNSTCIEHQNEINLDVEIIRKLFPKLLFSPSPSKQHQKINGLKILCLFSFLPYPSPKKNIQPAWLVSSIEVIKLFFT